MSEMIVTLPPVIVTGQMPESLAQATLALALTQEGVKEEGKANWGPKVQEYLKAAGVTVPAAWCAAYVNWCAEQTAKRLGVKSPLELVPNQAYVQSYAEYGKKHGWEVERSKAQPGDLILFWSTELKRYAHMGIVTGWTTVAGKRVLATIEGNTNDEGSREGYEVAKRTRSLTNNVLILRWSK